MPEKSSARSSRRYWSMSDGIPEELEGLAKAAAVRACWEQWVGLGSLATPVHQRRLRSIIDPEALLLMSLYVSEDERRLGDLVRWWASVGSPLTSVQRLRAMAKAWPGNAGMAGLGTFAAMAVEVGDRRWARHATQQADRTRRSPKGPPEPALIEPSALWPRLRAGFGVGAKADALVFLLGLKGAWASVKVISHATSYSSVAIRKAVTEMAQARLIREAKGRPSEYQAPQRPWAELLELYAPDADRSAEPSVPSWRFWGEIFAFLAGVAEWSRFARSEAAPNPHVVASRARDLVERHQWAFHFNSIPVPPPEAYPGRDAVTGLEHTMRALIDWMIEAV
jgi:hypothetical protein